MKPASSATVAERALGPGRRGNAQRLRPRFSLSTLVCVTTIVALAIAYGVTANRLRLAQSELRRLRQQVGYLDPKPRDRAAAVRVPADEPLTYRFRVRVPRPANKWEASGSGAGYRLVYSTVIPENRARPAWYGALPLSPGESAVTVRIAPDPRDDQWKVSLIVRGEDGTRRIGSTLNQEQVAIFRASHDVVSTGVNSKTQPVAPGGRLRLLDDRWLAGEAGALLYGERPVKSDLSGVYVELQSLQPATDT